MAADVDPDDGCGRTTRQGRTVPASATAATAPATAPAAPAPATAPAAAQPVAGPRPTWWPHVSAHGVHAAAPGRRGEYAPVKLPYQ